MPHQKVAGYVRNSSSQQVDSAAQQEQSIRAYCDRLGLDLITIYYDRGISGIDTAASEREGFQRMLEDAKTASWTAVVAHDQSRFSRSDAISAIVELHPLIELGIELRTCDSDQPVDMRGDIASALRVILAQHGASDYVKKLGTNVLRGQVSAVRDKHHHQGGIPWGYDRIDGRLIPNEDEAPIVRKVFQWHLAGEGYKAIRKRLMDEYQISKPVNAIAKVLKNRTYIGELRYGASSTGKVAAYRDGHIVNKFERMPSVNDERHMIIVPDAFEPIISKEDFQTIQKGKKKRAKAAGRPEPYLLTGLCTCTHCGGSLTYSKQSSGKLKLRCSNHVMQGREVCQANLVAESELLERIVAVIQQHVADDVVSAKLRKAFDIGMRDARRGSSVAEIAKRLERAKAKADKYEDRLLEVSSSMAAKLTPKVEQAHQVVGDLENQLAEAKRYQPADADREVARIEKVLSDLPHHLKVSDPALVRTLMLSIIDSIGVDMVAVPFGQNGRKQYKIKNICIAMKVKTGAVTTTKIMMRA